MNETIVSYRQMTTRVRVGKQYLNEITFYFSVVRLGNKLQPDQVNKDRNELVLKILRTEIGRAGPKGVHTTAEKSDNVAKTLWKKSKLWKQQ